MAFSAFTGLKTYVLALADTAFGTPSAPAGATDYWDKVTSGSYTITNNFQRFQGLGEGRDATHASPMGLDVTGSLEWQVTDPDIFQYCIIGTVTGAGTNASPYKLGEVNRIGFGVGEVKTLTLEIGSVDTNNDVMTFDGVAINSWSITGEVGGVITATADWIGRSFIKSTSTETYTAPANRPFTFVDSQVKIGSDPIGKVQNFTINGANNLFIYRGLGSRLIAKPEPGVRRYDFTINVRLVYDDSASLVSGVEARSLAFDGTLTSTAPLDAATFTAQNLSVLITEGSGTGQRTMTFQFENAYIESVNAPVEVEGGVIMQTITGFALAGLTDTAIKTPLTYYTHT